MTTMRFGPTVPWAPEALPINRHEFDQWTYVVLEEIVDEIAVLRRWPWPTVDRLGRLVWTGGTEHQTDETAVDLGLLKSQLYTPNGLLREPRCGDVFAVPRLARNHPRARRVRDLRDLLGTGALYDISADAREAARIAYQSSVGAIRREQDVDRSAMNTVRREMRRRARRSLRPLVLSPPPVPVATRGAGR